MTCNTPKIWPHFGCNKHIFRLFSSLLCSKKSWCVVPRYRTGPGINKSIARSRVLNLHFFPSPKQAAWNEVSFTLHAWHVPNLKLPRCPTPNLTTSALKFQVFDRVPGHSKVLESFVIILMPDCPALFLDSLCL